MNRVMCIWLPDWSIQYRQQTSQHDRKPTSQALVLYDIDARRGPRVAACSSIAKSAGVRLRSPLADARALLDHFAKTHTSSTKIQVEPHNPRQDRERLQALAAQFQAFSPIVGLEESDQPECLLLDITGCAHLFDGEYGLSSRIIWELYSQGLFAQIATADTVGAAWAVAHRGTGPQQHTQHNPQKSKQSRKSRPRDPAIHRSPVVMNMAAIIDSGQQAQAIAHLPVDALRLPKAIVERLHEFDLDTIQKLEKLPRSSLPARFGPQLLQRLDEAHGRRPEPIHPEQFPVVIRSHWLFEDPTTHVPGIHLMLDHLLEQLVEQAQQHRHGLLQMEFRLHQEDLQVHTIRIGLASPSTSLPHLKDLLRVHRERLRLNAAVERIEAQALQTVPVTQRQRRLFDDDLSDHEQNQQLTAFIDRLSNRLGATRVVRPRLLPDHQPEKAVSYHPLIAHAQPNRSTAARSTAAGIAEAWYPLDELPPRPILLDPSPRQLVVHTGQPPFSHPQMLQYADQWVSVQCCWGPERIETGWWRGELVRRDYYRVELSDGRQLWLFHQPDNGIWFHHGAFD